MINNRIPFIYQIFIYLYEHLLIKNKDNKLMHI